MTEHDDDLSLTDPHFFATGDPQRIFANLRRDDPVHWTKSRLGRDFWSVTKHKDVQAVLRDPLLFSSREWGPSLPTNPDLVDPTKSEHARLQQAGAMLPTLDPPRHRKARAPFAERFTLKAINALESRVREVANKILDSVSGRGQIDFVKDVAARLPITMIFSIMDIPEKDWEMLFKCANMHTAPEDPEFSVGSPIQTRQQGAGGLIKYCRELAQARRPDPHDDLVSLIATVTIDGFPLNDDEMGFLGHMFVIAGQDTTRNSLSAGFLELLRNPDEIERLRSNPALLRTAPDEFIRWGAPVAHLMRTATADTELRGKVIHKGDWVVNWIASANRDEEVFSDPFRLDIGRARNPHLSFGFGEHFCLGAFLARLQIRVMLQVLLERFERFELAGEINYVSSIQFVGLKRLPVRLVPRQIAA
jgi:cholest-4-en-3-one 26-monooxygenase